MKDAVQEQLIQARRRQILDAAAKVFAEKGFHPTTIKDIARAASIAEGTIYNYFENKTALLLGIFEVVTETAMQDTAGLDISEMDFATFLKGFLQQPLQALKTNNFALFRIVMSEIMVNPEVQHLYYQRVLEPTMELARPFIHQWIARGEIKPVDPDLLLHTISSLVLGLVVQNIMGDPTLQSNWDDLPDFLLSVIVGGIGGDQS